MPYNIQAIRCPFCHHEFKDVIIHTKEELLREKKSLHYCNNVKDKGVF